MFYEKQYKFILFKKIIRQIIQLVLQKIIWSGLINAELEH